jgi:hypothetical protein
LSVIFVGTLAQAGQYYVLFALVVATCVVPLGPTVLGWIQESVGVGAASGGGGDGTTPLLSFDRVLYHKHKGIIYVTAFMGIAAPITTLVVNALDPLLGLVVALLLMGGIMLAAFVVFPPSIARVALYQILVMLSRPAMGSAMDYFYTSDEACNPGGPHFSYSYYLSTAMSIGIMASLFGSALYQNTMTRFRYRTVLMITTCLSCMIGASDLFLVLRWNVALGIPDHAAYIIGEAVLEPLIGQLYAAPIFTLMSKIVPRGLEGSTFAFLAGANNYAYMMSELSGVIFFNLGGVRTVMPCNFKPLWWLVLLFHTVIPFIIGMPSAWFLIPNKKQTDSLVSDSTFELVAASTDSELIDSPLDTADSS